MIVARFGSFSVGYQICSGGQNDAFCEIGKAFVPD